VLHFPVTTQRSWTKSSPVELGPGLLGPAKWSEQTLAEEPHRDWRGQGERWCGRPGPWLRGRMKKGPWTLRGWERMGRQEDCRIGMVGTVRPN